MKIREYTKSDRNGVLELLALNTPDYFSPEEERDLIHYLENEVEYYYLVEMDESIVGCGGINLAGNGKTAKMSWDIVHPDYQRKGIGTKLAKYRIDKSKQIEGVETVSVRTSQFVYTFYEKFGLKLREIIPDYWAKGFDMYRLDCEINTTCVD